MEYKEKKCLKCQTSFVGEARTRFLCDKCRKQNERMRVPQVSRIRTGGKPTASV